MRSFFVIILAISFFSVSDAKGVNKEESFDDSKKSCSVYYFDAEGYIFQLPTKDYELACDCSIGYLKVLSKGAAWDHGAKPTIEDAGSIELRNSCEKLNNDTIVDLPKHKNLGVKADYEHPTPLLNLIAEMRHYIPAYSLVTTLGKGNPKDPSAPISYKVSLNEIVKTYKIMEDKEKNVQK